MVQCRIVIFCSFADVVTLLGGIVTFTAAALVADPVGILERMTQVAEHPLWSAYILPSVLGMAVKHLYQEKARDPIAALDRYVLFF